LPFYRTLEAASPKIGGFFLLDRMNRMGKRLNSSKGFQRRRSRRQLCLIFVSVIVGLWALAWFAAQMLLVKTEKSQSDAIAILAGSGTYVERAHFAANLFNAGNAPIILLTNDGEISGWSIAEDRNPLFVERTVEVLRRDGVPPERIRIIPNHVTNTFEEATTLRAYTEANGINSILVITSPYQSRRALWTLRRVFTSSRVSIALDFPHPGTQTPSPAAWWLFKIGWKLVPGEYLKLIYYWWRY